MGDNQISDEMQAEIKRLRAALGKVEKGAGTDYRVGAICAGALEEDCENCKRMADGIKRLRAALKSVQGWIVDHDHGFGVDADAEWKALDEIVRAALEEVPRG